MFFFFKFIWRGCKKEAVGDLIVKKMCSNTENKGLALISQLSSLKKCCMHKGFVTLLPQR